MKKSLLALAVLGAFAGAASAQSSVTVYGIVDVGVNSTDLGGSGTAGRTIGLSSGGQSASRFGFKGTEDLGGGLSAIFQLEGGFAADTGSSSTNANTLNGLGGPAASASLFNRISTVGLQGGFGVVNLGRQTTLLKDAHDQIDPFGAAGATGNLERIFYDGLNPSGGRVSNSVKYTSPSFSGFKASASYVFGETADNTGANRQYGLGLGYTNGPLNVQFGYNDADIFGATGSTIPGTTVGNQGTEVKVAFLGAVYNFGVLKLHGAYADSKFEEPTGGSDSVRNAMIGVSVPFGAGTLLASYATNDVKNSSNEDSKQLAIGYTYDLSKRTNLYTGYARTSNDSGASLGGANNAGFTGVGTTAATLNPTNVISGNDVSVFNVGVRHKF